MSRKTALRVLIACRTKGAWADAALKVQIARDGLSGPDAALCSRLVYGVMQNQLLLDFYLGAYCSQPIDHLQPPLSDILRLGAYRFCSWIRSRTALPSMSPSIWPSSSSGGRPQAL